MAGCFGLQLMSCLRVKRQEIVLAERGQPRLQQRRSHTRPHENLHARSGAVAFSQPPSERLIVGRVHLPVFVVPVGKQRPLEVDGYGAPAEGPTTLWLLRLITHPSLPFPGRVFRQLSTLGAAGVVEAHELSQRPKPFVVTHIGKPVPAGRHHQLLLRVDAQPNRRIRKPMG